MIFEEKESAMEEQKTEKEQDQVKEKKKKTEDELPVCTTAPSAEHSRGDSEDEPCDDSRSGE
jgi:hypothetical protein